MALKLFKPKPVLDEISILWMIDVFEWCLKHFDAAKFYNKTPLVIPSEEYFPGRDNNPHKMATMLFGQAQSHAGLNNWPLKLIPYEQAPEYSPPVLTIEGSVRGDDASVRLHTPLEHLVVPYDYSLLRDPQVLIATYVQNMAHYLGIAATAPPPGGTENWPHITELIAVFLGFGVLMANTAYTAKIRSCASCSGPSVERTNFLSQYDITYALAIFATLKNIPTAKVNNALKSTLRPFYKKAIKDLTHRSQELEKCRL